MPSIEDAAAAQRAALAAGESETFDRLLTQYGRVWQNVDLELGQLTEAIRAAEVAGEEISPSWLYREQRLANLKAKIETEVATFARGASAATLADQAAAVAAAPLDVAELVGAGLGRASAGAVGDFAVPSTAALNALVGHLADGSPVRRLFAHLPGDASQRAEQALIRGVARGLGPRAIARDVRQAMGGNLARALTIVRTETNRAYRRASQLTMADNADLLDGWRWTCARQLRTCAMCWAMDGTVHPVTATLDSHPNCRCAPVPVVRGGITEHPPPARNDFAKLNEEHQRAVLGRAKAEAYRRGELDLSDLVGRTDDRQWGTTRHELSLEEALKGRAEGRSPVSAEGLTPEQWDALRPSGQWTKAKQDAARAALDATEDGKMLSDRLRRFQSSFQSVKTYRTKFDNYVAGRAVDAATEARAGAFYRALANSPAGDVPETLFRGMRLRGQSVEKVLARWQPGELLDMRLSSFTSNRDVARRFTIGSDGTRVIVELTGDAKRALPVENLGAANFAREKEWITDGIFEVADVAEGTDKDGAFVRLRLRAKAVFNPTTDRPSTL